MPVQYTSLASSTVSTASGASAPVPALPGGYTSVAISVTAVSGTTPSATFELQWSNDGSTWASADSPDTFTAITAAKNVVKSFQTKGRMMRLAVTVSGTTPSFTWSADAVGCVTDVDNF